MAKGLSQLQKGLLLMAQENIKGGDYEQRKRILLNHLHKKEDYDLGELPHLTTFEALQGCNHAGARVSISRAFKRLEERGLAQRFYACQVSRHLLWSGINLTSMGQEIGKRLKVNTVPQGNHDNH